MRTWLIFQGPVLELSICFLIEVIFYLESSIAILLCFFREIHDKIKIINFPILSIKYPLSPIS